MNRRRTLTILLSTGLLGTLPLTAPGALTGGTAAAAPDPYDGPYCSDNGGVAPCILGGDVTDANGHVSAITSASTDYGVSLAQCDGQQPPQYDCDGSVAWSADDHGSPSVDPTDTWTIRLLLGSLTPTTTDTRGDGVSVQRARLSNGDWKVTITGSGTLIDDASSCDLDGNDYFTCGQQAASSSPMFEGFVSDNPDIPAAQDAADFGDDTWTNAGASGTPIWSGQSGDETLTIPAGNPHLHADGTQAVGYYHDFLPNADLAYFGITDPSTLTPSGLKVVEDSGDVSVTPEPGGVQIDITDIIWPSATQGMAPDVPGGAAKARSKVPPIKVKRGLVDPTRPRAVGRRVSARAAKLTARGSRQRGSRITGYQARCFAITRGLPRRQAHSRTATLRVTGLAKKQAYACQVRALSKGGDSPWSKPVTINRHSA